MIFRDDTPFVSYNVIVSREGDTDDSISLLPFHRSLILYLISVMQEYPEVFFNDTDEINAELFTDTLDDINSRLTL